ncbi:MAG TPA: hypothetical protein ENH88_12065 [Pseudoalteromonas prydzensis]|uniref:Uncharacterized protein n=1 Tax=Pseudoalteromonas prydzensis TaxID=182141 RepID=A0A7V1CZH2_9GAMM|nr:hypothetical protein [Pseudoalteromonas prydzensis]HEA17156.1 hypothetical protein [Pseudoalteromonas prydzensis]
MMKKVLVILFVLFASTHVVYAKSAELLELKGFKEVIKNVHYLAKVKITNVEILREEDESEKHVYFAEVLATYKGKTHKKLSYEMVVEQGEDVVFNSAPVYVALCLDEKGTYYWPGTGSEFKPSLVIDTWLTENKSNVEKISTDADWCE